MIMVNMKLEKSRNASCDSKVRVEQKEESPLNGLLRMLVKGKAPPVFHLDNPPSTHISSAYSATSFSAAP